MAATAGWNWAFANDAYWPGIHTLIRTHLISVHYQQNTCKAAHCSLQMGCTIMTTSPLSFFMPRLAEDVYLVCQRQIHLFSFGASACFFPNWKWSGFEPLRLTCLVLLCSQMTRKDHAFPILSVEIETDSERSNSTVEHTKPRGDTIVFRGLSVCSGDDALLCIYTALHNLLQYQSIKQRQVLGSEPQMLNIRSQ